MWCQFGFQRATLSYAAGLSVLHSFAAVSIQCFMPQFVPPIEILLSGFRLNRVLPFLSSSIIMANIHTCQSVLQCFALRQLSEILRIVEAIKSGHELTKHLFICFLMSSTHRCKKVPVWYNLIMGRVSGSRTKEPLLEIWTRQHCRLSICGCFGWVDKYWVSDGTIQI